MEKLRELDKLFTVRMNIPHHLSSEDLKCPSRPTSICRSRSNAIFRSTNSEIFREALSGRDTRRRLVQCGKSVEGQS